MYSYTRKAKATKQTICTLVTAYYSIPSKSSNETYMKWIFNLMQFKNPIVMYTPEEFVPIIKASASESLWRNIHTEKGTLPTFSLVICSDPNWMKRST